jgi:4-hydroxy-tetrahydrodipicolinate synthase
MAALAQGIFSAALTPLDANLNPDHAALVAHCRWLLANGCDGLAVLGTTGEANSFTVDERLAILDALEEAGISPEKLLPGTGCAAYPDTVRLTARVAKMGAKGALVLPPFYYKNVSDEGVYAAFARIIEGVGDSRLRLYLYHFPQMAMVPINRPVLERLLKEFPGTVVGMKDSSGDLDHMCAIAKDYPGFSMLAGADDCLLPLLRAGGAGCITAVSNVAAPLAAEVYKAFKAGGDPSQADAKLSAVRKAYAGHPLSAALKETMARHTGNQNWRRVRPPLVNMPAVKADALAAELARIGFAPPPA